MPGVRVFVDTNTIIYSRELAADPRIASARRWLSALVAANAMVINLQVLNELTHVLFRKRVDLSAEQVFSAVDELVGFGVDPITLETVVTAREIHQVTSYSWWDCLLLASALELGCSHFLSEDLQDGQTVHSGAERRLTIVDPFAHQPETILAIS